MSPKIQQDPNNMSQSKKMILELLLGSCNNASEIAEILHIQKNTALVHVQSPKSLGTKCRGLHDKTNSKSLDDGKSDVRVELEECMALGDQCRTLMIRNVRPEK